MKKGVYLRSAAIMMLLTIAPLCAVTPKIAVVVMGAGGLISSIYLGVEFHLLYRFLMAVGDKKLGPKTSLDLVVKHRNNKHKARLLELTIKERVEKSGGYAWGLACWIKVYSEKVGFDWMRWVLEITHAELGLKLHAELDRIRKFFEEHPGGLANESNQEYVVKLMKNELAMMLEVCGEEKPYSSLLPILAETSTHVREELFRQARTGRQFPNGAELTDQKVVEGNNAYQQLLTRMEEEVRNWPIAEPIS